MGLLDVLRGGEAEARDDADANSEDEQQPEREETGLFGGLMNAVDQIKEFVGVDDDADEPPAHQVEASSSQQPTQGVEVAAVVRTPRGGGGACSPNRRCALYIHRWSVLQQSSAREYF